EIARGEAARVPWLQRFYFGTDGDSAHHEEGLKDLVSDIGDIDARDVSSFPLAGTDIVVRVGRYGPYLERDGQRVNVPEGTARAEPTPARAPVHPPWGPAARPADPRAGRRAVRPAQRGRPARHRPGHRAPDRREERPVRPVPDRGAARG